MPYRTISLLDAVLISTALQVTPELHPAGSYLLEFVFPSVTPAEVARALASVEANCQRRFFRAWRVIRRRMQERQDAARAVR